MILRMAKGTQMTPTLLAEYIGKHKAEVGKRYSKLQDAYENRYDIFKQARKPDWKPDNRISVNYAKYIVNTMNGFFIGSPVKVTSDDDAVNDYLQYLHSYNNIDDNNSELSKIADIHGSAYEMYYIDEDSQVGITHLSPMNAFIIYDESIIPQPMYFIRYYMGVDRKEHGSWSDESMVQYFVREGSYKWVDEPKAHLFDGVPAVEYVANEERMGLFEDALPMINAYNKAISEKANDVDYFADAYLKVLGGKLTPEDLKSLRRNRIINLETDYPESGLQVEFLQKPDSDSTQENLIDRLERQIFQISMVANISEEDFGNSSGIALRYRMAAMSNLAQVKERKFTAAMAERYRLIFSHPALTGTKVGADDWTKLNYHFTRNYPVNVSDEAETAQKLEGIVSKETQLRVLSLVKDPVKEMEQMANEEAERVASADSYSGAFGHSH